MNYLIAVKKLAEWDRLKSLGAIERAVLRERQGAASYADQPFHATPPAERLPHFEGSDLVGAGESPRRYRSVPPQKAGRLVGIRLPQKWSRNAIWISRGLFSCPLTTPKSELPNWLLGGLNCTRLNILKISAR
jgi:hypothetical protein